MISIFSKELASTSFMIWPLMIILVSTTILDNEENSSILLLIIAKINTQKLVL